MFITAGVGVGARNDCDDIRKITRRINGGYNGLDDRIQIYNRARAILVR